MSPVRVAGAAVHSDPGGRCGYTQFSLALDTNGIVSWGLNTGRAVGDGTLLQDNCPRKLPAYPTLSRLPPGKTRLPRSGADGSVWRWGRNITTPAQVMGLPANAVGVALGQQHAIYLMGNGTVWARARTNQGLLGTGVFVVNAGAPPAQVLGLTGITRIAAHNAHSLRSMHPAGWAQGHEWLRATGDGTTVPRNTPVQVERISSAVAHWLGPVIPLRSRPMVRSGPGGGRQCRIGSLNRGGTTKPHPCKSLATAVSASLILGSPIERNSPPKRMPASSQRTSNSIRVTGITNGAVISVDAGAYSVG